MADLHGEVRVRGVTAPVDASFIDILESADSLIGVQGHVEARYGPWGGFVDGTYLKQGVQDIAAGPTTLDVKTELVLMEFGALYRLGEWRSAVGSAIRGPRGSLGWRSIAMRAVA